MADMDVKVLPSEGGDVSFEHHNLGVPVADSSGEPSSLVKVKFTNFAKLVATHSFEDILEKNASEEVVMSADLLADLANADLVEDEKRKRYVLVLSGIAIGILLSFIILGDL